MNIDPSDIIYIIETQETEYSETIERDGECEIVLYNDDFTKTEHAIYFEARIKETAKEQREIKGSYYIEYDIKHTERKAYHPIFGPVKTKVPVLMALRIEKLSSEGSLIQEKL